MINRQELIRTLKGQHMELKADLAHATEMIAKGSAEETLQYLLVFQNDLLQHLALENGTFYPDYLSISHDKEKIETFINEMVVIGENVKAFLKTYDTAEAIAKNSAQFAEDLRNVVAILTLRIETEEEGLYEIYAATT